MFTFNFKQSLIVLCISALTLCFSTTSSAQIGKTFVRSYYLTQQTVTLNLGDNVIVETWKDDNTSLRVEMAVQFGNKNVTNDLIKEFVALGRYLIVADNQATNMVVSVPNTYSLLGLNGKSTGESIRYTVRVPRNTLVLRSGIKNLYSSTKL